jgi:hypothetical protein
VELAATGQVTIPPLLANELVLCVCSSIQVLLLPALLPLLLLLVLC